MCLWQRRDALAQVDYSIQLLSLVAEDPAFDFLHAVPVSNLSRLRRPALECMQSGRVRGSLLLGCAM
jgi:hypothetical protein